MRSICLVLLVWLCCAGCQHQSAETPFADKTLPLPKGQGQARAKKAGDPTSSVTPVTPVIGKVVSVNANLRFVVIDFAAGPLPELGERLNIYRQNQKVAEARVSGPFRKNNAAGDILAGEAQIGDEVRK